jgi:uncharacterized protein (TIGR00299 family) protein
VRALIIDPFVGISGDMLLGGLVDLGLPGEWLRELVASTGLPGRVHIEGTDRNGIACTRVWLDLPEAQSHRHLPEVLEVIEASGVPGPVRERAGAVFRRLAEAEAEVHGVPVERVHFHEVGALDSILDILCGTAGVYELGFDRCYTRPVGVGSGTREMSHGSYPIPAPATVKLLEGFTVRETGYPDECTTPTGAALLAELTGGTRVPGAVVYGRSGYGAGSRDPEGRPNCLRLLECRVSKEPGSVLVVQADLDDMSPEYVAAARETLMAAGALDVTLTPIDMKKGRPGVRLEALVDEPSRAAVVDAFFSGTRTIGVRFWRVERAVLERTEEVLDWRGHPIRVKTARLPDGRVRRKPEYDDVVVAARAEGLEPHELRAELERMNN